MASYEQLEIQLETARRRTGAEESQARVWQQMAQEYREEFDEAHSSAAVDAGVQELEERLHQQDAEALRCRNQESFAVRHVAQLTVENQKIFDEFADAEQECAALQRRLARRAQDGTGELRDELREAQEQAERERTSHGDILAYEEHNLQEVQEELWDSERRYEELYKVATLL